MSKLVLLPVGPELVANQGQRRDRVLAHHLVDVVRAELRPLEQARQATQRGAACAELEQRAAEILHRGLSG